jgi:hypothetical protein
VIKSIIIKEDWERTISVSSVGIGPKIERLSLEQKTALMESGERYTRDFFEKRKQCFFNLLNELSIPGQIALENPT